LNRTRKQQVTQHAPPWRMMLMMMPCREVRCTSPSGQQVLLLQHRNVLCIYAPIYMGGQGQLLIRCKVFVPKHAYITGPSCHQTALRNSLHYSSDECAGSANPLETRNSHVQALQQHTLNPFSYFPHTMAVCWPPGPALRLANAFCSPVRSCGTWELSYWMDAWPHAVYTVCDVCMT
jgi:hypothetical protein